MAPMGIAATDQGGENTTARDQHWLACVRQDLPGWVEDQERSVGVDEVFAYFGGGTQADNTELYCLILAMHSAGELVYYPRLHEIEAAR